MATPFVGHAFVSVPNGGPQANQSQAHGGPYHRSQHQHAGMFDEGGRGGPFFDSPQTMSEHDATLDPHRPPQPSRGKHQFFASPPPQDADDDVEGNLPGSVPVSPSFGRPMTSPPSYEPRRMEAQLAELQRRRAEQNNHVDFAQHQRSHQDLHQRPAHVAGMGAVGAEARSRFDELLAAAEADRHGGNRGESLPFDIGAIDPARLRKAVARSRAGAAAAPGTEPARLQQQPSALPPAVGIVEANGGNGGEGQDEWVDEPDSSEDQHRHPSSHHPRHDDLSGRHSHSTHHQASVFSSYPEPEGHRFLHHEEHASNGELDGHYPYGMLNFQHQYAVDHGSRQYDSSQDEYLDDVRQPDPRYDSHPHFSEDHHRSYPAYPVGVVGDDVSRWDDRHHDDADMWTRREGGDEKDLMDLETSIPEWTHVPRPLEHGLSPRVVVETSSPRSARKEKEGIYPSSGGTHHLHPRVPRPHHRRRRQRHGHGQGQGKHVPYEESEESLSPSTAYSPRSSRRSSRSTLRSVSPTPEDRVESQASAGLNADHGQVARRSPSVRGLNRGTGVSHTPSPHEYPHPDMEVEEEGHHPHGAHVLEASGETVPDFFPTDSSSMSSMGKAHATTALAAILQARKLSSVGSGEGGGKGLQRIKSAPMVMGKAARGVQDIWTDEEEEHAVSPAQQHFDEDGVDLVGSRTATAGDLTHARIQDGDMGGSLALTADEVEGTASPYGSNRHGKVAHMAAARHSQSMPPPTSASSTRALNGARSLADTSQAIPTMASATSALPNPASDVAPAQSQVKEDRSLEPWHFGTSASGDSAESYDQTSQSSGGPPGTIDLSLGIPPAHEPAAVVRPAHLARTPSKDSQKLVAQAWPASESDEDEAEGQKTPTASSVARSHAHSDTASISSHSDSDGHVPSDTPSNGAASALGMEREQTVEHPGPVSMTEGSVEAQQLKAARQVLRKQMETPVRGGKTVEDVTPGSISSSDPDLGLSPITEEATVDVRAAELNSTPPNRRPLPFRLNNLVTSPTGLAASRPGGSHSHQTPAPAEVATEAGPTPDTPFGPTPSSQPDTPPDELRSLASTPSPIRAAMGMQLRPRRTKPPVKPPPPISLPAHTRRGPLKDELHREELREWNEATGTDDRYALPLQTMAHTVSGQPEGTAKRLTGVGNEERRPIKDRWGNVWGMESHLLSPLTERTEDKSTTAASLSTRPSNLSLGERSSHSVRSVHSNNSLLQRLNSADLNSLRTMRSQPGLPAVEDTSQEASLHRPLASEEASVPISEAVSQSVGRSHASRVVVSTVDGPFTPPVTDEDARARFVTPPNHVSDASEDSDAAAREERFAKKEQRRQRRQRREERKNEDKKRSETMYEKSIRRMLAKQRKEEFLRQKSVIIARLQATPQDPELLRGLGEVYLESGGGVSALKLAVRHLEASLQLDETDPRCWQLLGKAWARLHEAPDSATYQPTPEDRDQQLRNSTIGFRKAIVNAPYEEAVLYKGEWADYLWSRNRFSDAIVVLQEASRNEGKNDPTAHVNLALMYLKIADEDGVPFTSEERLQMLHTAEARSLHAVKLTPPEEAMDLVTPMILQRRGELEEQFGITVTPAHLKIASTASSKRTSRESLRHPDAAVETNDGKEGSDTASERETAKTEDESSSHRSVTTSGQRDELGAAPSSALKDVEPAVYDEPSTPRVRAGADPDSRTLDATPGVDEPSGNHSVGFLDDADLWDAKLTRNQQPTPPETPKASAFRALTPSVSDLPDASTSSQTATKTPSPPAERAMTPVGAAVPPPAQPVPRVISPTPTRPQASRVSTDLAREPGFLPQHGAEDDSLDDPTSALLELDASYRARALEARRKVAELEEQHERERAAFLDRLRLRRRANSGASSSLGVGYSPAGFPNHHATGRSVSSGAAVPLRSPAPSYTTGSIAPFAPRDFTTSVASGDAMQRMLEASRSSQPANNGLSSSQPASTGQRNEAMADVALQAISAILRLANPQPGL